MAPRPALVLIRACFTLWCVDATFAVMGFDCSRPTLNISAISLRGPGPCAPPHAIPSPVQRDVQIVQQHLYEKTRVRTCRVELEIRVYRCAVTNINHGKVRGGHDVHVHWLTPGACAEMHDRGTASIYGNKIANLRVNEETSRWLVIRGNFGRDAYCHGMEWTLNDVYYDSVAAAGTARILLRAFDAKVDARTKLVILPSGVRCDFTAGHCRDVTEGNVVWNAKPANTCSTTGMDVIYTGPANITSVGDAANKTYLTVATEGRLLALVVQMETPFSICNTVGHLTTEPRIFVLFKSALPFFFTPSQPLPENVDLLFYINSKALFLDWTAYHRVNTSVAHAVHEHCLMDQARLEALLALARVSPDPAAKILQNSVGFTAIERANVLYLAQCEARKFPLRLDDKCWNEIPVWDKDQPVFLQSVTRILVPAGTEVDCSSVLMPLHFIDYRWIAFTPNITNATAANIQELQPTASSPDILPLSEYIGSAGPYDADVMRELQSAFQFPAVRAAVFNDFARRSTQPRGPRRIQADGSF
ncbi:D-alanine--D-alanine ligase [Frankliniella fusca]|uniref:D-alanine--D-alanine ligase n=1 Tax=Frankliniella fusca TaxID=407009 RepID=A0AAE1H9W5_9NEOP|nr:D-alanine--D-alanine ligase [Frankliniella fusca]